MNNIVFKWRDELIQIHPTEIVYFQADGNYSIMVLTSRKEQLLTMNLSKVQITLDEQMGSQSTLFERVGRDLIIQKAYVFSIQVLRKKLVLAVPNSDKHFELSVSKEALKALKETQQIRPVKVLIEAQLRELQTRKIYPLIIGENRLGRKSNTSECELAVDNGDSKISRQQCSILVTNELETGNYAYTLTDLNSANGTYLNDEKIPALTDKLLLFGAIIRVGNTEFMLEKVDYDKTEML